MMKQWLRILLLPVCLLFSAGCGKADTGLLIHWKRFVAEHLVDGGRVVDRANGNITHSEGQAIAMLIAEAVGDRKRFDQIWFWTKTHLQVRDDKLFAWRWSGEIGGGDNNNATDGDILIAWSLLRASKRWRAPALRDAALEIVVDIRNQLTRNTSVGQVLLPGGRGFEKPEGVTINLSYIVFPAIRDFIQFDLSGPWAAIYRDSKTILFLARFGRWNLPPNWLLIAPDGTVRPTRDNRFGYDAVRIPLYLTWAGVQGDLLRPYVDFWTDNGRPVRPWVDLTNDRLANYPAEQGIIDIASLVLRRQTGAADLKKSVVTSNYYSDALRLLTMIAAKEGR